MVCCHFLLSIMAVLNETRQGGGVGVLCQREGFKNSYVTLLTLTILLRYVMRGGGFGLALQRGRKV